MGRNSNPKATHKSKSTIVYESDYDTSETNSESLDSIGADSDNDNKDKDSEKDEEGEFKVEAIRDQRMKKG